MLVQYFHSDSYIKHQFLFYKTDLLQNIEDMVLCFFYTLYCGKIHMKTKLRESSLCSGRKNAAFRIRWGFQNLWHFTDPASYIVII